MSLLPGALQNDIAEHDGRQHVHGLIAGFHAGGGHILHQRLLTHRPDGIHHTHHDQDQQANQQSGGQDLSHDVHHRCFPHAQQQDQQKEEDGEERRTEAGHQRGQRGFVGGGGGPGDSQHGADAQHNGAHERCGGNPADAGGDPVGTSLPENGKHSQRGQSDVGHKVTEKAGQPLRTRFQSQIRGEDDITCAEKHGEQGETDDQAVLKVFLHRRPPLALQVDGCPLNKGKAAARTTRGLCIYLMFMLETIIFEFPKKVNVIHTGAVMGGAAEKNRRSGNFFP